MHSRALLFLALPLLAAMSSAQGGPPPRDLVLTKQIFLVFRPAVKADISVTPNEEERIKDAFEGSLEVVGEGIRLTLTGGQDLSEMERSAMAVLTDSQRKRLAELWIQHLGGVAIADDNVAKKLSLTPDQRSEADRLIDDAGGKIAGLMSSDPGSETRKKVDEIRVACGKQIVALLTDEQKKAFEQMKGAPMKQSS